MNPMMGTALSVADDEAIDALTLGRNIRERRKALSLTLEQLALAIDRAPSQLSAIENGKREPKLSMLHRIATALDTTVDALLDSEEVGARAALEIAVERAQRGSVFQALGIEPIRVSSATSDETLKAVLALHQEVERLHRERAATPEEARRANTELRKEMRIRNNYFSELEDHARDLLNAVGYAGGPVSQLMVAEISKKLGFTLHYVNDLPHSTRSVVDKRNGRIYLGNQGSNHYNRTPILRALASIVCEHEEPRSYEEFLRQRVEANYLAGAVLLPEEATVKFLEQAREQRQISMEDLRDAFAVSYETAAHRFTNLATHHLGMNVHFMKVHESGTLIKAYENDNVKFPSDALGAFEGSTVCRRWTARTVFAQPDRFNAWYQYTDMPDGRTYWCTSRIERAKEGDYSVSVGVPFEEVKWFRGRETTHRTQSWCPEESCCRTAPHGLSVKWDGSAWPEAATPTSLLAALPTGAFPGVDSRQVYEFLERYETRTH